MEKLKAEGTLLGLVQVYSSNLITPFIQLKQTNSQDTAINKRDRGTSSLRVPRHLGEALSILTTEQGVPPVMSPQRKGVHSSQGRGKDFLGEVAFEQRH